MENRNNIPAHGFSVGTILLLTVVVAIGAAAIRTLVVAPQAVVDGQAVLRSVAGGTVGLLVGIYFGAMCRWPIAGMALGIFVGGFAGAVACAALVEPKNLPTAAIGSALLILLGVVVRVLSPRPPRP